jgi:hypothetical protein
MVSPLLLVVASIVGVSSWCVSCVYNLLTTAISNPAVLTSDTGNPNRRLCLYGSEVHKERRRVRV